MPPLTPDAVKRGQRRATIILREADGLELLGFVSEAAFAKLAAEQILARLVNHGRGLAPPRPAAPEDDPNCITLRDAMFEYLVDSETTMIRMAKEAGAYRSRGRGRRAYVDRIAYEAHWFPRGELGELGDLSA